jgi:serine/threonine protein phosphatase PrpC
MAGAQEQTVRFAAVGTTDVGKVREHNEDNFLASDLGASKRGGSGDLLSGTLGTRGVVLVVADGMGGAAAGEVASQMAVETMQAELNGADLGGTIRAEQAVIGLLEGAINKANASIFEKGSSSKEFQGMGTTMTAAVVLGDSLYLSQVGDSRGYILRKGKLVQMTRDQSLINQLIEDGTLTEEQAEHLGGKNIILQALGVEQNLKIDSKRYDLLRGDTLLLCSDGLSGMVKDAEMEKILLDEPDLVKAGKKLIDAANAGGGKDNITVILGRFEGEGLREPLTPLSDAEKTGVSFKAPPPPKGSAGRNAMIGAAAFLAVVGAVVFWPKDIRVYVTPDAPCQVVLKAHPEGGPAGFAELSREGSPSSPAFFTVPKGRYVVVADADGYQAWEVPLDLKGDVLEQSLKAEMVRDPAKTLDLVPPPYKGRALDRVLVKLVKTGDTKGRNPEPRLAEAGVVEFTKFPAGSWKAEFSRPGFKDGTMEFEVVSDEEKKVELPAMEEMVGTLLLEDAWEGASLQVLDGEEELLAPAARVLASGRVEVKVRATKVTVVVAREGAREFRLAGFDVKADATQNLTLREHQGQLSFKLGAGQTVVIRQPRGLLFQDPDPKNIPPGEYTGEFSPGGGQRKVPVKFTIHPGEIRLGVDPATLASEGR